MLPDQTETGPPEMSVPESQPRVRQSVPGIEVNGLPAVVNSLAAAFWRPLIALMAGFETQQIGFAVLSSALTQPFFLFPRELQPQFLGNLARYLFPKIENVVHPPAVLAAPQLRVACDVNQCAA